MKSKPLVFTIATVIICVVAFASNSKADSWVLDANPNYSFFSPPTTSTMAAAIQARLGKTVTVVSSLAGENTSYPPILGNSGVAPFYIYGPSSGGVIKNLNLFSDIVTGIVSAQLKGSGTEVTGCGDTVNKFTLRVFSTTQYWDVLVKYVGCSGTNNVVWDFYRISGPRNR